MFDGGWWRGEFGGALREEKDRRLFAYLARGGLLRYLPAGAEETLPLVEAALEEHLDRPAYPERDAPRPGNPFPSLPTRGVRPPRPFPDSRL